MALKHHDESFTNVKPEPASGTRRVGLPRNPQMIGLTYRPHSIDSSLLLFAFLSFGFGKVSFQNRFLYLK